MDELNRISIDDFQNIEKHPIWIILDDVRSMNNVGSVFRTSDAFNIEGISLCGLTPQPPHRDIHKTALGATESVNWRYEKDIESEILRLKKNGYKVYAVEQTHNSHDLQSLTFSGNKTALIFGNEVQGVSNKALSLCDYAIEIPQWGTKHSLNISVCVGVVLWEMVRVISPAK